MSYSKEQFKKIYQTLPPSLKEALGSVEIQDEIDTICQENGVADETLIDKVYNVTMDVFMGLVHPDKFDDELTQILQEHEESAREIAHRIRRFVLFPLKTELAQLHRIGPAPTPQFQQPQAEEGYMVETEEQRETEAAEETPQEEKRDTYREPVE